MALAAVDLLIGRIVSALQSEASLIGGVRDELNQLQQELKSMKSFLEDADRTTAQTEGEKTWVDNVRDLTYKAENIIDEFMYHMNKQEVQGKFRRLLCHIVYAPKNLWVRHRIATQLQEINNTIKAIPERNQRYRVDRVGGANSGSGSGSHDHQGQKPNNAEDTLFVKDDDLVGIEDGKRQLLGWLMDKELQRTVISVVGMGGSGKTTLVAQAYNNQTVKQYFHCYAWITVSQTYVVDDLLRSMIKEFYSATEEAVPLDLSRKSHKELLEMISNYLKSKRYLVVLDDVWSQNLWQHISVSLPDEGKGSRVILTTRKEDVASFNFGVKRHVHHMNPLGVKDAWNLFCKKAFSSNRSRCCPKELESLAHDLVAKCEGLPLAIAALGGVMSTKHMELDWRKAYNSLSWELGNNPELEAVKTILLYSFNELPYQLKHCFLYCCLFPEDYRIRRKRLIRLWMAEGFVEKRKGLTVEEVADSYLMDLVCRSMLQVIKRNPSGRPKECKMHDLVREIALSTSETEKFCVVYDGKEAKEESGTGARRLSIQTNGGELQSWKGMLQQLRSLLVFSEDEISLPRGLRLLKVLDLQDVPIEKLPNELVDLFNLRYLNLKRTKVKELPKSIGRLCNLETLDIRDSKIQVLPTGITKLKKLRHLIMYRYNHGGGNQFEYVYGTAAPANICKLTNLQVLACVEAESDLMKRLRNMTQLKRIDITKLREADEVDLCIAIQKMNLLHYLCVMMSDENECLRMDKLSSAPPYLKTLILVGKLEKVPRWFDSLQNLTNLYLHWSRLEEDLLPCIQELPSLGKLTLINACEGRQQLCFSTGFPKLRNLRLRNFPQLNEIIIEKGVMPALQEFLISECMQLKMLPHGIEYLKYLQKLTLLFVTNELQEQIRGEESEEHPQVGHIPCINIMWQSPEGIKFERLFNSKGLQLAKIMKK
ncbi:disease resistance protein RPM1-like isoform X1 [Camellia sinensis]|uniref:disease resistance protein RPM1-like isoform X1 n=1 Tax=Camellia sinensis TaxID=4442 RepID=UPI0010368866|nr:disease resistance protein RPM1-like isoform X1 [Camellia sinensis]